MSGRLETTAAIPQGAGAPWRHLRSQGSVPAMAWTYILKCSDGTYYVGSTVDLQARLTQHREGRGAAYTRHRLPVTLAWSGEFERIDEAFAFEKRVQGWSRKKREALIADRLDLLPGLSRRRRGSE